MLVYPACKPKLPLEEQRSQWSLEPVSVSFLPEEISAEWTITWLGVMMAYQILMTMH